MKVGTDSSSNITTACTTSISSLDLIQPLWNYDGELEMKDSDDCERMTSDQNSCTDDKHGTCCHASQDTECSMSLEIYCDCK